MNIIRLLTWGFLLASVAWADASGDWAGTWHVKRNDDERRFIFEQEGEEVTGQNAPWSGRFEGKMSGNRMIGRWTMGGQSREVVLILSDDKERFSGRDDLHNWLTGTRMVGETAIPPMHLRSPREALKEFIVAGNLARFGRSVTWDFAAQAIEFVPSGTDVPREVSLNQVRNYFDLIDLTTFDWSSVPLRVEGDRATGVLKQDPSEVSLSVEFRRNGAGDWHLLIPSDEAMEVSRRSLLEVYGKAPPTADSYRKLQNPRDTMRVFLQGMREWEGNGRKLAFSTIDLRGLSEIVQREDGLLIAEYLRRTLDQIGLVNLQAIPNDGADRTPYVHFVHGLGSIVIAPSGSEVDAPWQFTKGTVEQIRELYMETNRLPPLTFLPYGSLPPTPYFLMRDFVAKHLPWLLGRWMALEYWQMLVLFGGLSLTLFFAPKIVRLVTRLSPRLFGRSAEISRGFVYALTVVVLILMAHRIPVLVGIPAQIREHTLPVLGSVFLICVAVVLWHLLTAAGERFGERARKTQTQADDLVLHFVIAGGRVAIVVGTALRVAYFFSMPAASILAGLSIGGLAFAIAARETLANLFGAGTLVTDRPFRSGDWIDTGTLQGSVEAVGIRSTRIRTAQDSVAIIPNGKLSEATINNLGTRRHRVIKLKILVTEGATPERLEGLIAAIRHRLEEDPLFLMKRTEIGVTDIGSDGVSIVITADINVRTDLEESLARHDLLMDLLRFAEAQRLRLGRGVELSAIQP